MAVRGDWTAGEVLTADDLNDTVNAKADAANPEFTGQLLLANGSAAAPRTVLNDHLHAHLFGQLLAQSTRHHVGGAAGGKGHDQPDRLARIGLGQGRQGGAQGAAQCGQNQGSSHGAFSGVRPHWE